MLALCVSALVAAGVPAPAGATQAPGNDVTVWQQGWSWTYNTTFRYAAPDASATVNERVTATVTGLTTYHGQSAYQLSLSGTVTGGSGSASGQSLSITGGSVGGHRIVRRSDLALLEERQVQHITGKAAGGLVGVTADVDITLTPTPTWRQHDFPLNAGDSWQLDQVIAYDGSFSYDAGSIGGSGSDTMNGTIPFAAPVAVSNQTISAAGGSVATQLVDATKADSSAISRLWWSPTYRNDARDYLKLPLDDATLEIDRVLSSASTPAPANAISATATPSLTCAGGTVTVAGTLSTAASGVPVSVTLDQSQINAGQTVATSTTTGTNGTYSATLTVPAQSDGLQKNGSRANWGVVVSAPSAGANNVTTVVVTPKNCSTIAYTGSSSAAQYGDATVSAKLTDQASAGGAAGRTVTFTLSDGGSVSATTNASGVATASLPIDGPPRSATITASFAGAANLEAAGDTQPFTVTKAESQTGVAPSAPVVTIGDPITFTALLSPLGSNGVSGGTVQFLVDGSNFGGPVALGADGSATSPALMTNLVGVGDHTVQAVYSGDADYNGSSSPSVLFRVRNPLLPTTTTQTATPSAVVSGQTVTLSADVSTGSAGEPATGSVTFTDGATVLGEVGLDAVGHASLDVSTLAVGSHGIVAAYSGDDVYNPSSSAPTTVSVAKADVQVDLASADVTTVTGEAVNLSASVAAQAPGAGVPTGALQLVVDGNPVGDPVSLVDGTAVFAPVTTLGKGDHTVAVSYSGDAAFRAGADTLTQFVTWADTTTSLLASPSPSAEDQAVTLTATVAATAPGSGAPTGTVVFSADGDVIGAAPLGAGGGGSEASLDVSTLAPGPHTLTAWYGGDADYIGSQSDPVGHTVIEGAAVVATSTSLSSSANPSTYGQLVTFTATVAAADETTPTGTVQFFVDGADVGDPVEVDADGVAVSPSLASPDPGDHTVIAAYLPTAGYSASGDILTQTVEDAGVDLALESSATHSDYGQGVTFTATVTSQQVGTGTPTGYVQFAVDGAPLGDAVEVVDGVANSPSLTALEPGSHTVTALYSGDTHFVPASASLTQHVAKVGTTTTLSATTTSPTYGDTVGLTATVTAAAGGLGLPAGTVTFRDGTTTLATVPVSPGDGVVTASISRSDLDAGSHEIVAEYAGTPAFAGSTSAPVTVTIAKRPTHLEADAVLLRLSPLLGVNVGVLRATLTTSAGPLAGQTVVFSNGATTVCTATTDASGLASCNAPLAQWLALTLAGGFTAGYPGTANYAASSAHGGVIK